jgi:imidazole glycerol-phosphate synthase subunit HisH
MTKLVDYGVGNIQAFMTLFKSMGLDAQRAQAPQELDGATHLVLPGVGHFDHAMQRLNESRMRPMLEEMVTGKRVPVLGVCVGMQMLAAGSDEGSLPGLNWVPGRVRAFSRNTLSANLPMASTKIRSFTFSTLIISMQITRLM